MTTRIPRSLRRAAVTTVIAGALTAGLVTPAGAATAPSFAQWSADVTAVTTPAKAYIAQRIAAAPQATNLAIVLDIDNTALANYYNPNKYPAPATAQVLDIADYAHAHGVKVFFITARPELIDEVTEYNLSSVGYPDDGLYSRDFLELFENVATFKTRVRANLEAEGWDIIANIGNNLVDIDGGHDDSVWKLPDYNGLLD